ncbi:bifunctional metallophosphatase/5'-nucleotidase [Alteraurantiacibacter aestuarii]|uniref:Bifunctional metallophosphatase/5'-nucleotidase n=1 Tax=Alteraurantiacibacter aestuarii TaxID=650004 RepID=A0A844ZQV2_9SPHN|nr:bifunctional metallophosphatase/5'-nucleotidase [Alteraurantiacibacter aestuarii]MXO89187.1 bifunctional metallophosphatase/5'-nucleotidase [Alteraurantiacibacter aestuarii]
MNVRILATLPFSLALAACVSVPDAAAPLAAPPVEIQILALNDFHGYLEAPAGPTSYRDGEETRREELGGAANMGAALARLRSGQAHTITVAAGDLIGASPFLSANFLDEPSIMALSAMGLELASVGNHEFDRGVEELRRMQDGGCAQFTSRQPCALDDFPGAGFTYLAGNAVDGQDRAVFTGTALRSFGPLELGFVGLTLKDTGSLVSPAATAGYRFLDEAQTANALAQDLIAQGADSVVLLIHEGGRTEPFNNVSGCPDLSGAIVPIMEQLDPAIALVVSGHTHNAYACAVSSADGGRRMLTSAGRYGTFVTDIRLTIDPASGHVAGLTAVNVPIRPEPSVQADIDTLVQRYAAAARPIADRVVGEITLPDETGDACIEQPAQALVADAQLAAARRLVDADVALAFINSGGVRSDLAAAADGVMTYGEIFAMQPFGNRLVVLELTGAQIGEVLEQQLCGDGYCYSYLIPSANFTYGFDRSRPEGARIVGMMLDGEPIDPQAHYLVSANNFIASGGDGFTGLAQGTVVGDGGLDVDALENYLAGGVQVPACGRIRQLVAS